jgi:hypothetical protein
MRNGARRRREGAVRPCQQRGHLLILRPVQNLPHFLSVPPGSLNAMERYLYQLSSGSRFFWGGVTKLRLERTQNPGGITSNRVQFSMGRIFTAEERERLRPYQVEMKRLLDTEPIDARYLLEESYAPPLMLGAAEVPITPEEHAQGKAGLGEG